MPQHERDGDCGGLILAGGRSRRMGGGDKGLLDLAGRPMLARVIERLMPQVDALAINANGDPGRFTSFGLPVVADTVTGFAGPLAGVLAGMRWTATRLPGARHIATVTADAPFIPMDLVARLRMAVAGPPGVIAVAASGGEVHPVIGLWPLALADDLAAALQRGERKVQAWTERHGAITVEFPCVMVGSDRIDPFFNVNTPGELAEARRLAQATGMR